MQSSLHFKTHWELFRRSSSVEAKLLDLLTECCIPTICHSSLFMSMRVQFSTLCQLYRGLWHQLCMPTKSVQCVLASYSALGKISKIITEIFE